MNRYQSLLIISRYQSILLIINAVLMACAQPIPQHPEVEAACKPSKAILDSYDCPESARPDYVAECEHIAALGYIWVDDTSGPSCVLKAKSLADVRACNVECPQ